MLEKTVKRKFLLGTLLGLAVFIGFLSLPYLVDAQQTASPDLGLNFSNSRTSVSEELGLPQTDIRLVVARIIRGALGLLGIIALALILYAGYTWMTAGGDEEKVSTAKKILTNSVIGLIIILSSYAIVNFVISRLLQAVSGLPQHCYNGIQDEDETAIDRGGSCGAGGGGGVGNIPLAELFYVKSLPGAQMCSRNAKPAIVFNRAVDLNTFPGNIIVFTTQNKTAVNGTWSVGHNPSMAVFTPTGSCAPANGNDCFAPNTEYTLHFEHRENIFPRDASTTLDCTIEAKCDDVTFTTAEGVDTKPPTVHITYPVNGSSLEAGVTVPVNITFSDDLGMQNVTLAVASTTIASQSFPGCQKSGNVTMSWPTASLPTGEHVLEAVGLDSAAQEGIDRARVNLRPAYCFDGVKSGDETNVDCGGVCGACSGTACSANSQCASGTCEAGRCVEKMSIQSVDPLGGAPGTYVTIFGRYFGVQPGKVYFSKKSSPVTNNSSDWIEAKLVACGSSSNGWGASQIIVEVPQGTVTGPIKVETALFTLPDKTTTTSVDTTRDGAPAISDFLVTSQVHPGLCSVTPSSAPPGTPVVLNGARFGTIGSSAQVLFGTLRGTVSPNDWGDALIKATVPSTALGTMGVKVRNSSGVESNSVRFTAESGVSADSPIISSVTPDQGAVGEYITITGKNFGTNKGRVWLRLNGQGNATDANYNFPKECESAVWSNTQVIVKFPSSLRGALGKYSVQIYTAGGKFSSLTGATFTLEAGDPAPGICKLTPLSGPVPLAQGQALTLTGEYFFGNSIAAPTTNLTLHYTFDNDSGSSVTDSSGKGMTGQKFNGATLGTGQSGQALVLDGNDDYVSVNGFNPYSTNYTFSAWVNPDTDFTKRALLLGSESCVEYFEIDENLVVHNGHGVAPYSSVVASKPIPKNQWTQVAASWDGKDMKLYINGILEATRAQTQPVRGQTVSMRLSGGCQAVTTYPFKGRIDNVRVYTSALTADDINNIFTQEAGAQAGLANVYFYRSGASPNSIVDRLPADQRDGFATSSKNGIDTMVARPPAGTETGPVAVYRSSDKKMSNPLQFSVWDCVKNNNTCTDPVNSKCCAVGAQTGVCVPANELCAGENRSTGYIWRFSTQDIPPTPRVVERCEEIPDKNGVLPLPSPSPSIQWNNPDNNDQSNVCRSALITVEFTSTIDPTSISASSIIVNECASIENNNCVGGTKVALDSNSFKVLSATNGRSYVALKRSKQENGGQWGVNKWYQVVLMGTIKSTGGASSALLLANKPCQAQGSAYCFAFRSDDRECALSRVIVTPYKFLTQILESPIQERDAGGTASPLFFRGSGLSNQRCIMMDTSGLNWKWDVENKNNTQYATIHGRNDIQEAQVDALANTVAIGLASPDDAVSVRATVSTGTLSYPPGKSPLTIDLSNPQVVDHWPNCLEACTNAQVGARFNISLSSRDLLPINANRGAVRLLRCNDENCLSTTPVAAPVTVALDLDASQQSTIVHLTNLPPLAPNTFYKVILSASTTDFTDTSLIWARAKSSDPASAGKAYKSEFSWKFKTKSGPCAIGKVTVAPALFNAAFFDDRSVYQAEAYSSPDSCSKEGQKVDPWKENWSWSSSDQLVASVTSFNTQGKNSYCTAACIRKGSDVPADEKTLLPVCGNGGQPEAGEDCDGPDKTKGCSLDCRFLGNLDKTTCGNGKVEPQLGEACDPADAATKIGCSAACLRLGSNQTVNSQDVNASVCGNGTVGSGEACDVGINSDPKAPASSLGCSNICLHLGTRLSIKWCFDHSGDKGGFTQTDYDKACKAAFSQCGDKVLSPDEDTGCDDATTGWNKNACDERCLKKADTECQKGKEGCDDSGRHTGSSLTYSTPSVCGDGTAGVGEDAFCETNLSSEHQGITDPWVLAQGVGFGQATGEPKAQRTTITASLSSPRVQGSGQFLIGCGFKTDTDCAARANNQNMEYGVGADTCCYARPKLASTYPADNQPDVCPNTTIEAVFNTPIDAATLVGNVVLAKEVVVDPNASPTEGKCSGTNDVTTLIAQADGIKASSNAPWYKKAYHTVIAFFRRIFGSEAIAAPAKMKWCVEENGFSSEILNPVSTTTARIGIKLSKPLATTNKYAVILKEGLKDTRGVSIGKKGSGAIHWEFTTYTGNCEIGKVAVEPKNVYFSRAYSTTTLAAKALTKDDQQIQPIAGTYVWEYTWGPMQNPYVRLSNTTSSQNIITAENRNGEIDMSAAAKITENRIGSASGVVATGRSHAIIFLCENPWPPKDLTLNGQRHTIFPYEDKDGNNDGFDLTLNLFNNTAIPRADSGGYFNFSDYYCADQGSTGTFDDLPFLRPAVQTSNTQLQVDNGACEFTGDSCQINDDCGFLYTLNATPVAIPSAVGSVCGAVTPAKPFQRFYIDGEGKALSCKNDADCTPNTAVGEWAKTLNSQPRCLGLPISTKLLACYKNSPLKRFIFTNDKNADAIGMQVFTNPQVLTAEEWYSRDKSQGGQGFVSQVEHKTVDGYEAISDGSNFYVDAVNYSDSAKRFYSNIYLFSVNADAKPETRKVFEQLIGNVRFNSNLTNYGYCGSSTANPGLVTPCKSDFDCKNGEVCSVQIDKLKRNYTRLRDFKEIEQMLTTYAIGHEGMYPELKEGTYLTGQTISTWPSWSVLSNATGQALPLDPLNQLAFAGTCASSTNRFCAVDSDCGNKPNTNVPDTCVLHDATTGWSTVDRRFSFACAPSSTAYRYIYSTSTGYTVRARFEDQSFYSSVGFFNGYVDQSRFVYLDKFGICNQDQEIQTINQGRCGDGQVNLNLGETCDPPAAARYGNCSADPQHLNEIKVEVCSKSCGWVASSTPFIACSALSKCGNGLVETGEVCDDGKLNGRYNHCNNDCKAFGGAGYCGDGKRQGSELCEISSFNNNTRKTYAGWCVTGKNFGFPCDTDAGCDSSIPQACVKVGNISAHYATAQKDSCNFDCQSYGPYCGDGIVQTELGEECESDAVCSIGGVSGANYCGFCRKVDIVVAGWWRMDDLSNTSPQVSDSSAYDNHAACSGGSSCPTLDLNGKVKQALDFDGQNSFLSVRHNKNLMATSSLTITAWVKPNKTTSWMRILEKGGFGKNNGYTLQFNQDFKAELMLWKGPGVLAGVTSANSIAADGNTWTHIATTYERVGDLHILNIYINGNLENTATFTDTDPADRITANTEALVIGRRGTDTKDYFSGSMDEVKVYLHALSASQVENEYKNGWFCSANVSKPVEVAVGPRCGDGTVDAGEVCDNGDAANGLACTPGYGKSCSYCSADCSNIVDVQPKAYCGNGIIDVISGNKKEACDVDPNDQSGTIYASATSTGTEQALTRDLNGNTLGYKVLACNDEPFDPFSVKKGNKSCANNCLALQSSCVSCGAVDQAKGVAVKGSIINVLDPANPPFKDSQSNNLDFYLGNAYRDAGVTRFARAWSVSGYTYELKHEDPKRLTETAYMNSDTICSYGPEPNYMVLLNNSFRSGPDQAHAFKFPIFSAPETWRYDLLLSPVIGDAKGHLNDQNTLIANSATPDNIRIVVSWVEHPDFNGGFLIPLQNVQMREAASLGPAAVGTEYFNKIQNPIDSIWYHGFGETEGRKNVQSFTINTKQMSTSTYIFYIRTDDARTAISRFENSANLRVEVYLPETDTDFRHFARPTYTYELKDAVKSTSSNAIYWHVFNIKKADGNISVNKRIEEINKVRTDLLLNYNNY